MLELVLVFVGQWLLISFSCHTYNFHIYFISIAAAKTFYSRSTGVEFQSSRMPSLFKND